MLLAFDNRRTHFDTVTSHGFMSRDFPLRSHLIAFLGCRELVLIRAVKLPLVVGKIFSLFVVFFFFFFDLVEFFFLSIRILPRKYC